MGRHGLSTGLLVVGAVLLSLCLAVIGYAEWVEWQHSLTAPTGPGEVLAERLEEPTVEARLDPKLLAALVEPPAAESAPGAPTGSRTADHGASPLPPDDAAVDDRDVGELGPVVAVMPSELAAQEDDETDLAPTTATSTYGRPTWLSIPRIRVDSRVSPVRMVGGEYQVPAWDVGYHADSAEPGELGNSVFNGHLTTINAGRVFARLRELRPNDAVYVYTATHRLDWVVTEVRTVPNTDDSFVDPTEDIRITLYTCAGQWDPRVQDYTHRQVVVAKLVSAAPRS
jgi:LPXTG-site transpeptidase (sortase) family protein